MATLDPADEAGGEIVYSDDGMAPATITKPPQVYNKRGGGYQDEDQVVSSEDLSPQLAFEVFQGKIYSSSSQTPGVGWKNTKETPLARLARLQQEVAEVEAQMSTMVAGSGQAFDEPLVALATTLKSQLMTLLSSSRVLEQDDLTRLIRQQLSTLEKDPSSTSLTKGGAMETGVVYELYGNATNPTTTVEDRLVRLERAVGSQQSSSGSSSKTLLQRLEEMESLVKTVDAVTLEQTTTKAKVIRADLEAASKARNKLAVTYKKEDSKIIQQLHTQLMELEGMSSYLPALVERLQQLASLHVQAGTFASRLEALETSANQLSSSVSSAESTMETLASNLTTNLKIMETNLQTLDERLKKL
jgi:Dynamitin